MRTRLLFAAALALPSLAVAPQASRAAEPCPNGQLRHESKINPATDEPFDLQLPECRAYEMVSPLEKQQHDAIAALTFGSSPALIAPEGNVVLYTGEGDYAEADNYQAKDSHPTNGYVSTRTANGWATRSAYPPSTLIEEPAGTLEGTGLFSPDLLLEASCGAPRQLSTYACALRRDSSWSITPTYTSLSGTQYFGGLSIVGASSALSTIVFYGHEGNPLLPSDTSTEEGSCRGECGGIYSIEDVGTEAPQLRLVDVNNSGEMIGPKAASGVGAQATPGRVGSAEAGSEYQAISEDGATIYFIATPPGGVPTIYARLAGKETVTISQPAPSECTRAAPGCNGPADAIFAGASANGAKVFFETKQQLVNADTDSSDDLYEYNFNAPSGERVTQVSGGGAGDPLPGSGAEVMGVVRVSEDGSRVYFVAKGVLTTLPNGLEQTPTMGAPNLYVYDSNTEQTKFVATLTTNDGALWGEGEAVGAQRTIVHRRLAQTTPDGEYLVFDTHAQLITSGPEAANSSVRQVYRYDSNTGAILRISIGHDGFADNGNEGREAAISPMSDYYGGADVTVNDLDRAISEDGNTIAFSTTEALQATDVNGGPNVSCAGTEGGYPTLEGCDVYVWHYEGRLATEPQGEVNLVSDGQSKAGSLFVGMSTTGSDIFFQTRTQLVGQDTDNLGDIYDARIDGGFPAPMPEPSCSGEECQGTPTPGPTFTTPSSLTTAPRGNLSFATIKSESSGTTGAVKITSHSRKAVSASVPGAGSLALSGGGLVGTRKNATKAGVYTLALTLTKTERKLLAKRGHVTLTVTVRFTPITGGSSSQATEKLTIRKSKPKRKSTNKKK